jgi:hypothetical protein
VKDPRKRGEEEGRTSNHHYKNKNSVRMSLRLLAKTKCSEDQKTFKEDWKEQVRSI